jgi:predicted secreted protein
MTMTLLLIASAWMLVLWLAAGICAAARLGDRTRVEDEPVTVGEASSAPRARGTRLAA